jgi:hypothetical protein
MVRRNQDASAVGQDVQFVEVAALFRQLQLRQLAASLGDRVQPGLVEEEPRQVDRAIRTPCGTIDRSRQLTDHRAAAAVGGDPRQLLVLYETQRLAVMRPEDPVGSVGLRYFSRVPIVKVADEDPLAVDVQDSLAIGRDDLVAQPRLVGIFAVECQQDLALRRLGGGRLAVPGDDCRYDADQNHGGEPEEPLCGAALLRSDDVGRIVLGHTGECLFQIDSRIGDVVQALPAVFLQAARHQSPDAARHASRQRVEVGIELQHRRQRVRDRVALEGRAPAEHLVEHRAERPHVAAVVHAVAAGLLGTHVGRGAQDHTGQRAGRGQRGGHGRTDLVRSRCGGILERAGQTEVEHLDPPVSADLDVGRLEVAVDHAGSVRGFEPFRDLSGDLDRLVERERSAFEAFGEVLALDELHGEEADLTFVVQTVNRGDSRVVQRGQQLRLALQAGQPVGVAGQHRRQDLDRHLTIECRVEGPPDHTHPARADLLDQAVVQQLPAGFDGHSSVLLPRVLVRSLTRGAHYHPATIKAGHAPSPRGNPLDGGVHPGRSRGRTAPGLLRVSCILRADPGSVSRRAHGLRWLASDS